MKEYREQCGKPLPFKYGSDMLNNQDILSFDYIQAVWVYFSIRFLGLTERCCRGKFLNIETELNSNTPGATSGWSHVAGWKA